ncbi:MAG: hypothetical protein DHS20C12_07190 [Pseudohongiella sp.]|nr:MAG: hypothetical protein DHS20C12_07190 [Pseudohongiella sp.]
MQKTRGLSLSEMLISLAVLSTLIGVALPDFRDLTQSISGDVSLRKLAKLVQLGKSAAIANGTTVTICRSIDGKVCSGNWQDGAIAFTDSDRDRKINGNDSLIRRVSFPNSKGTIRFRAFQNKNYLQVSSLGVTHYQNGNFTYCPFSGDNKFARQMILNRTARLRFAQDSDGDGFREDSRGRPLNCD